MLQVLLHDVEGKSQNVINLDQSRLMIWRINKSCQWNVYSITKDISQNVYGHHSKFTSIMVIHLSRLTFFICDIYFRNINEYERIAELMRVDKLFFVISKKPSIMYWDFFFILIAKQISNDNKSIIKVNNNSKIKLFVTVKQSFN